MTQQSPEYIDLSLIPTISPTPSVTPTPGPTIHPVVSWMQANPSLTVCLGLMVLFFLMMRRIYFPRDLVGDYISRVITLGRQARANMAQSFMAPPQ